MLILWQCDFQSTLISIWMYEFPMLRHDGARSCRQLLLWDPHWRITLYVQMDICNFCFSSRYYIFPIHHQVYLIVVFAWN